jgi:hypothetical protein
MIAAITAKESRTATSKFPLIQPNLGGVQRERQGNILPSQEVMIQGGRELLKHFGRNRLHRIMD